MHCFIKNDYLTVEISTIGAEIKSIYDNSGNQYMHDGENHWSFTAPVLFPITGRLKNNKYTYNGKEYELEPHGFCRRNEFQLVDKQPTTATFRFTDNEETLNSYPFHFIFDITYILEQNKLQVVYKVTNTTNGRMYFSIGSHEAYKCPFNNDKFEDYYIEFECEENLKDNSIVFDGDQSLLENNTKIFNLTEPKFYYGASWFFKNLKSKKVKLKTKDEIIVTVEFNNIECFGLWKFQEANFICLEPWNGLPGNCHTSDELDKKEGFIRIEKDEIKTFSHTITFGNSASMDIT